MKVRSLKRLFRIRRRKVSRSVAGDLGIFLMLAVFGVFMALPLVYAISQAFKPLDELFIFPPRFFVMNPTLSNFGDLFMLMGSSWVPFSRYIFNTVFITIVGTFGHLFIASMAAYALSKHRFPGDKFFFSMIVLSLMFSRSVTGIPSYLIMTGLGWIDNIASIIVPAFAATLGLYLMRQFMVQVPDSLLESARIDGASEFRIYWQIVMPAVKPAWLTLIIFSFNSLWNTEGSVFIYSEELKTLPYALQQILLGGIARAGVGAAVAVLMMIVPIIMFVITQSNIIETMASSGMKE
jgi:ABC-type glycerol-3-phosphate transport system permease component